MTGGGNMVGLIGCGHLRMPVAVFVARHARNETPSGSDETIGHLYINGQIVPDQSAYAGDWGAVSMRTVVDALNTLPSEMTKMVVHINSPGGYVDEGFAIFNTLETFKKDTGVKMVTRSDGQCASIATVIMLAGDDREIFSNTEIFVHNPWLDPWNLPSQMEASDLEEVAKQMRQQEDRILDFYTGKTGSDREILATFMEQKTALTPDQALEMKFATVILTDIKAMARLTLDPKNQKTKMSKPKKTVAQAAAELKAAAKKAGILALNLTTTDGKTLDITTAGENPAEGDEVKIDNEDAPDGDYEIENGDKLTVAGGKITAILPKDPGTGSSEEEAPADAAQAKRISTLEAQNKTLATKNADLEKRLKAIEAQTAKDQKDSDDIVALVQDLTKRLENVKTGFVPAARDNSGAQNVKKDKIDEANERKAAREAELAAKNKK